MPSMVNIHDQGNNNNEPLEFKCRSLDKNKIQEINNMLLTTNWSTLNNKDVNITFNELQERIDFCMNTIAPLKIVKISRHRIW